MCAREVLGTGRCAHIGSGGVRVALEAPRGCDGVVASARGARRAALRWHGETRGARLSHPPCASVPQESASGARGGARRGYFSLGTKLGDLGSFGASKVSCCPDAP